MAERTIQIVSSNPAPGRDDEFNEWYDNVHIPQLLEIPGMLSAQRYDLYDAEIYGEPGAVTPEHRYLTIYQMEGDVDAIMAKIRASVAAGKITMSDCLDLSSSRLSFWTERGPEAGA